MCKHPSPVQLHTRNVLGTCTVFITVLSMYFVANNNKNKTIANIWAVVLFLYPSPHTPLQDIHHASPGCRNSSRVISPYINGSHAVCRIIYLENSLLHFNYNMINKIAVLLLLCKKSLSLSQRSACGTPLQWQSVEP